MLDGHTYAIFQQLVLTYNLGPLTLSNGLNDVRIQVWLSLQFAFFYTLLCFCKFCDNNSFLISSPGDVWSFQTV